MSDSMSVVASDLGALTRQYQAITHNLANASTVGFKRNLSRFERIVNSMTDAGDEAVPGSEQVGHDVRNDIVLDFSQGVLEATGRPLDLALNGEGAFFVLETAQGPLYTRNGSFHLRPDGKLVDSADRQVAGENGPITIPATVGESALRVGSDGTISAGDTVLGKLKIVQVEDLTQLRPAGSGCYRLPARVNPPPAENAEVHQGYLEKSNVNAVEELVNLIQITRLYEAGVRALTAQDERLQNLMRVAQG